MQSHRVSPCRVRQVLENQITLEAEEAGPKPRETMETLATQRVVQQQTTMTGQLVRRAEPGAHLALLHHYLHYLTQPQVICMQTKSVRNAT